MAFMGLLIGILSPSLYPSLSPSSTHFLLGFLNHRALVRCNNPPLIPSYPSYHCLIDGFIIMQLTLMKSLSFEIIRNICKDNVVLVSYEMTHQNKICG